MSISTEIFLMLVCLLGSAWFSGIETGLVSINRLRLRHLVRQRDPRARKAERLLDSPERFLGTTLLGTNLCNTSLTVLGAHLATRLLGDSGPAVSFVVLSVTILLFGEYLPKAWFQSHAAPRTLPSIPLLYALSRALRGLTSSLAWLVRVLLPFTKGDPEGDGVRLTREEVRHLFSHESESSRLLSNRKKTLIAGVFSLSGKTCGQLMIPRSRLVSLSLPATTREALRLAEKQHVHRLPVFAADGSCRGVLHLVDVLAAAPDAIDQSLENLLRTPQFVPAHLPADQVIPRLRLSRQPMLLVRDRNHKVVGVITTEVVLAEIIGPAL